MRVQKDCTSPPISLYAAHGTYQHNYKRSNDLRAFHRHADPTLKDENGRDFEAFKEMVKERRKAANSQSVEAEQKVNPLLEKWEKQ